MGSKLDYSGDTKLRDMHLHLPAGAKLNTVTFILQGVETRQAKHIDRHYMLAIVIMDFVVSMHS